MIKISRLQLIALRGAKCEICGITEWYGKSITFDDHHFDKDPQNGTEVNRKIICPNCHRQQHLKKSGLNMRKPKLNTENMKGFKSDEHKQNIRIAITGTKQTEETKCKISKSLKGRKLSDEHCRNITAALSGQNNPMSRTNKERRKLRYENGTL